ncbi:MAG: hypothetical protein IJ647_05880 [Prevotella sp.]|nr:hypothetical protein [Prevotella sp.]
MQWATCSPAAGEAQPADSTTQPHLYYQWKPEYTIEKVVEMPNNFE